MTNLHALIRLFSVTITALLVCIGIAGGSDHADPIDPLNRQRQEGRRHHGLVCVSGPQGSITGVSVCRKRISSDIRLNDRSREDADDNRTTG